MKKNTLPLVVPCLVVCVLAFIDTDYNALGILDVVALVASASALVAIARLFLVRKEK